MSPTTFTITVDLTPPQLAWGTVAGTTAGELLRVAYVVHEPELVDADLQLADGRHLSFTIHDSWIEVLLPPDTPTGAGRIHATTRDDVDNEAVFDLVIHLDGAVTAMPGPSTTGGGPVATAPGPAPSPQRLVRLEGPRARLQRRYVTTAVLTSTSTARATSSWELDAASIAHARAVARQRSSGGATVPAVRVRGLAASRGGPTVRRDGQGLEEALLLELIA